MLTFQVSIESVGAALMCKAAAHMGAFLLSDSESVYHNRLGREFLLALVLADAWLSNVLLTYPDCYDVDMSQHYQDRCPPGDSEGISCWALSLVARSVSNAVMRRPCVVGLLFGYLLGPC